MRLKAKHDSLRNAALVCFPCDLVAEGEIVSRHGYADVTPKDEEAFIVALGSGVYPLSSFGLAPEGEYIPPRTTTLLTTRGQDADPTQKDLVWLNWTGAQKLGFNAKTLKEAALLGSVRTKDEDGKTVYCSQDLENIKAKQAQ